MRDSAQKPLDAGYLDAGYFAWQPPAKDVVVLLKLSLVEHLQRLTKASGNEEIGGVLLGRSEMAQNTSAPRRVWVDDFAPIESEHVRGPAYALSARDTKALQRYLAGSRRAGGSLPVGFFRSHLRKGIYLDEADFALFQSHFAGPTDVFLVARPRPGDVPLAGFFVWEEGALHRHGTYADFPLDAERLSSGAYPIEAAPLAASEPAAPTRPTAAANPSAGRATRPLVVSRTVRKGLYAGLGAALILTALVAAALMRSGSRESPTAVSLNVERQGDKLRLSWDPTAPAVARANDGILWISDGGARKRLELKPEALQAGSYVYTPQSPDVNFRLDLRRISEQASESVRYIADADAGSAPPPPGSPAPVPAGSVQTNPAPPGSAVSNPAQTAATRQPLPPPTIPDERPALAPPLAHRSETERARAAIARRTQPEEGADRRIPAQTRQTAAPLASAPRQQPEPPAQVAKAVPPPETAPPASARPVVQTPGAALQPLEKPHVRQEPTVSITTEPVAPTRVDKWVHHVPLLRTFAHNRYKAGGDFTPPRPSREVTPHVPPRLAKDMPGEWRVDLKLAVDSDGRVDEIQLMSPRSDERLVGIAADAMRQWRFTPARLKDKAVDCDLLVTLHFRNPTADGVVAQRQ